MPEQLTEKVAVNQESLTASERCTFACDCSTSGPFDRTSLAVGGWQQLHQVISNAAMLLLAKGVECIASDQGLTGLPLCWAGVELDEFI